MRPAAMSCFRQFLRRRSPGRICRAQSRCRPRSASPNARSVPHAGTAYRPLISTARCSKACRKMRGLLGFGANLLLAQADPDRGRAALSALEFFAHADLFLTPTAALADIVLPIASCFEREALKIGFEISADAQSLVQLRQAVVPPQGQARSDTDCGLRAGGSARPRRAVLGRRRRCCASRPARAERRYAGAAVGGTGRAARPVADPPPQARRSRRARKSAWLCDTVAQGRALVGDFSRSRLCGAAGFRRAADRSGDATRSRGALPPRPHLRRPTLFCQTQHRALPSLRRRAPEPEYSRLHPDAAAVRLDHRGRQLASPSGALAGRHAGDVDGSTDHASIRAWSSKRLVKRLVGNPEARPRTARSTIHSATTAPSFNRTVAIAT